MLFNIFINDIFHFVESCDLYNYADDNTVSYSDHNLEDVIYKLIKDSLLLIKWFLNNKMKANPEKFQAIAIGKHIRKKILLLTLKIMK